MHISSKARVFILVVVLALIAFLIPLLFYLLNINKSVAIVNENKYYNLSFKDNLFFRLKMNEWGVWKKDNVAKHIDSERYTVKKITIILTEKQTGYQYRYVDPKNMERLLYASTVSFRGDEEFVINLFINPDLRKEASPEEITKNVRLMLATTMYYSSNFDIEKTKGRLDKRAKELKDYITQFGADAEKDYYLFPFFITIHEE